MKLRAFSRRLPLAARTVRVKIDATLLLKHALVKKLNEHGKRDHLRFKATDKNYDYRIVFTMVQGREDAIPAGYYHKGVVAAFGRWNPRQCSINAHWSSLGGRYAKE